MIEKLKQYPLVGLSLAIAAGYVLARIALRLLDLLWEGGFKVEVQQITSRLSSRRLEDAMEKMENKERFPLSHGTAAAIYMNRCMMSVALQT